VECLTINGYSVPEPERIPPPLNTRYYVPNIISDTRYIEQSWENDSADVGWLKNGLVHRTKDAALAHAAALLSFTVAK